MICPACEDLNRYQGPQDQPQQCSRHGYRHGCSGCEEANRYNDFTQRPRGCGRHDR